MKKKWILMLAVVMLFAFTAGVVAAPDVQQITAKLATDFKITLNGNAWAPKDNADGSTLYPIVYKNRTYLPVRAVAEALDVNVDWDAKTSTVILGEAAVTPEPEKTTPEKTTPEVTEPEKTTPEVTEPEKTAPKPAADLAISPTGSDYNKNKEADVAINVT